MPMLDIHTARDISDRRLAALRANGEDTRATAAWRDACHERSQIERAHAFTTWARGSRTSTPPNHP
jgi:hypothetical protein